MDHSTGAFFFKNLITVLWVLACLGFAGIGPIILLSPRGRLALNSLLAPAIGIVFLTSIGLFRISTLLLPLEPNLILGSLWAFSLVVILIYWLRCRKAFRHFFVHFKASLLIPTFYLVIMSVVFAHSGFHLVSGSEDELQYATNSEHILRYQHRGGIFDTLSARTDHWVNDLVTRHLSYSQIYRRGAEITLASVADAGNLTTFEAFPITVVLMFIILLLGIMTIGRNYLRISFRKILVIQLSFISLYYFQLLHIQGSLANLCSIPYFLISLAAIGKGIGKYSLRHTILIALLSAGTFLFYSEPVLVEFLIPCALMALTRAFLRKKMTPAHAIKCTVIVIVILAVAHRSVFNAFLINWRMLQEVRASFTPHYPANLLLSSVSLASSLFGTYSYYDLSSLNARTAQLVVAHPSLFLYFYIFIFCIALFTIVRSRNSALTTYVLVCLFFAAIGFGAISSQDFLKFNRAVGYVIPFLILGTIASLNVGSKTGRMLGAIFLSLILWNFGTTTRTLKHVFNFNVSTDPILRRLNKNTEPWTALRQELLQSRPPTLITGFNSTVTPHWIAVAIEPVANFLGNDIMNFWPGLSHPQESSIYRDSYGIRKFSEGKHGTTIFPDWTQVTPTYLEQSEVAIVPPGGGYPSDWKKWMDIYTPKITTYRNVCDVVYKNKLSFIYSPESLGNLNKDGKGLFRSILKPIRIQLLAESLAKYSAFILRYDGTLTDISLKSPDPKTSIHAETLKNGQIELRAELNSKLISPEFLVQAGRKNIRIRKIAFE